MSDGIGETALETETILKKIVADFEELDRAIDAAILRLEAGSVSCEGVEALLRAKEAVRKGAALARSNGGSQ